MDKKWYVVHALSGFEKHVMRALQERVELTGLHHLLMLKHLLFCSAFRWAVKR